jgi:hypothetical protein
MALKQRSRGDVWRLWFALFGWAYLMIFPVVSIGTVPLDWPAERIFVASNGDAYTGPIHVGQLPYSHRRDNALKIGRSIFALIIAWAGSAASDVFAKGWPWRRKPASDPGP